MAHGARLSRADFLHARYRADIVSLSSAMRRVVWITRSPIVTRRNVTRKVDDGIHDGNLRRVSYSPSRANNAKWVAMWVAKFYVGVVAVAINLVAVRCNSLYSQFTLTLLIIASIRTARITIAIACVETNIQISRSSLCYIGNVE